MVNIVPMKILVLAALFISALSLQAQVGTSPRTLTRRIAPQLPPQPPRGPQGGAGAPAAAATPKAPATAADIEQKQMELSAEEKKKLDWEMGRAEKGSDPAQYTVGMRYLEGKGVPKDLKKARKWLTESAKQGNAEAKKALAEHPELPPLDKETDAKPVADAATAKKP
jgi:TPR repeat protein